ncbi:hypothetical protein Q762_04775 [Flavobacterium cauense R2A-7]|nr:hypothetical protein Q762_04775 [Flavobacterium cauense R2A-7]
MNFPNKPDLYRLAPMGAAPCKADSGKMDSKNSQAIRSSCFDKLSMTLCEYTIPFPFRLFPKSFIFVQNQIL